MKIVDSHVHIFGKNLKEEEEMLLSSMDGHGIDFSLISNCASDEFAKDGFHKSQLASLKDCLKLSKKHPNRFGALLWICPAKEGLDKESIDFLKKNREKVYGMKVHPYCSRLPISEPQYEPYLKLAEELSLPVLVHTAVDEYSCISHLVKVAKAYPKVKFIAAHLELFSDHLYSLNEIKGLPNVYGDTAWVDKDGYLSALDIIGEDRMLFGTDNPVDGEVTLDNPMYVEYLQRGFNVDDGPYEKLMGGNAIKLYGLKI